MAFTETEDLEEEQEEQTSAGPSNRNFWIIFGVLGGILLLALICMAVYAVFILPEKHEQARDSDATANASTLSKQYPAIRQKPLPASRPPPPPPTFQYLPQPSPH